MREGRRNKEEEKECEDRGGDSVATSEHVRSVARNDDRHVNNPRARPLLRELNLVTTLRATTQATETQRTGYNTLKK